MELLQLMHKLEIFDQHIIQCNNLLNHSNNCCGKRSPLFPLFPPLWSKNNAMFLPSFPPFEQVTKITHVHHVKPLPWHGFQPEPRTKPMTWQANIAAMAWTQATTPYFPQSNQGNQTLKTPHFSPIQSRRRWSRREENKGGQGRRLTCGHGAGAGDGGGAFLPLGDDEEARQP